MVLEFIKNEEKYHEFIRLLRTNPNLAYGFAKNDSITPEQQKEYMYKYGKCYYICLADGVPVGFVGAVLDDIRIATLPEYQRRGIGSFMVRELLKRHSDVYARIKIDNDISMAFFKKLGFKLVFHILVPEKE